MNRKRTAPIEMQPEDFRTIGYRLVDRVADLLFDHSLYNSHSRFWGYVTASAAPIGMLGDFLASAVNQNTGAWFLWPAVIDGKSALRACIVNFRTSVEDVEALPKLCYGSVERSMRY